MKLRAIARVLAAALLGSAAVGWSQSAGEMAARGVSYEGWHILSVQANSGYTFLGLPDANFNYLSGSVPVGSDVQSGASVTVGWQHSGPKGGMQLSYSPSYFALAKNSDWNSLNHSLNFHLNRKLSQRWDATFSVAGGSSNLNGFLFAPPVVAQLTAAEGSFGSIADAVLAGRYTNQQIAAILTGAPVLESPARTVLYGTRVLAASFLSLLSYKPSSRLNIHASLSGFRFQSLNDGTNADAWSRVILDRTTTATAGVGFSYALSPRTEFGVEATGGRSLSPSMDSYNTSAMISLGRKIGNRWFVRGGAGVATVKPLRQAYQQIYRVPQGPQPVAEGSGGYRTWRQSFIATVNRSPELYATGAGYVVSASGAWTWHHPGSAWQYGADVRHQRLSGGQLQNLDGWLATTSVMRKLNRRTAMQISYSYMDNTGSYLGAARNVSVHALQLAIIWQDQPLR